MVSTVLFYIYKHEFLSYPHNNGRSGAWWNLGRGEEVPKVVNGFFMYLLVLKMHWGEQQR